MSVSKISTKAKEPTDEAARMCPAIPVTLLTWEHEDEHLQVEVE